jgi:crotonobetainyl-CoA:carnitine CoA-transferase CaiB-like acyl-CoA transferase
MPPDARAAPDGVIFGGVKAPLDGIRVIDWTIWQQGPVSSAMLGDLGAEVIKLEEPERGDPGRGLLSGGSGVVSPGAFYFETNNRHKKSLAINLKHREAREIVYRLAERSDVFIQNFRQGVAKRLGLAYADLRKRNPRLIYASASGYGPEGPESNRPSFDYLGQARSGVMNAVGAPGQPPTYIYGGIADQMGAIMVAYGVVTALLARERYGVGQEIDASHLGSMMAVQGLNISSVLIEGHEMSRRAREEAYNPLWNHYRCADGQWLCLGMLQPDRYWKDLCHAMGLDELIEDPRYADMISRGKNSRDVIAIFDRVFATKPRTEWVAILERGGDFIFSVVNAVADLPNDPQVIANRYVVDYEHPRRGAMKVLGMPIRFSETPGESRGVAPELGEHTEQILVDMLGYDWTEVARLRESGVI